MTIHNWRARVHGARRDKPVEEMEGAVLILGLILLLLGIFLNVSILYIIGIILLVVGAVFLILGRTGRPIGGRKHWY